MVGQIPYIILLFGGFLLLWWAGDKAVQSSQEISYHFGFSSLFIGFALIALSTGMPELSVAIASIYQGVPGLSAGDILGSNFTDISVVIGLPSFLIGTVYVAEKEYKTLLYMLLVSALVMASIFLIGVLRWWHGLLLICLYGICMAFLWRTRHAAEVVIDEAAQSKLLAQEATFLTSKWGAILKLGLALFLVMVASEISVQAVIILAKMWNISLQGLGVTIFALGTSLPELTLSFNAIRRKEYSLALGNSLGSVMEQGLLVLGILSFCSPKPVDVRAIRFLAPFMLISYIFIGIAIYFKRRINRFEGFVLLMFYGCFLFYYLINYP